MDRWVDEGESDREHFGVVRVILGGNVGYCRYAMDEDIEVMCCLLPSRQLVGVRSLVGVKE